jgi:hypothetical protein
VVGQHKNPPHSVEEYFNIHYAWARYIKEMFWKVKGSMSDFEDCFIFSYEDTMLYNNGMCPFAQFNFAKDV